jgi:hypothetical protein
MLKKKTTRDIACQTDSEMSSPKENKSTSNVKDNVDTSPKQVISAPSKPNVTPKPRESSASKNIQKQEKKLEKDSESSRKLVKPNLKSGRIPKAMRDPISVHNRYNVLEEERMDTSSSHSRSHSLSPTKTRTKIKFNQS